MGNKPNNFIQCGLNQRDIKQQVSTSRQEAIKINKGQQIFKRQSSQTKTSINTIITNKQPQLKTNSQVRQFSNYQKPIVYQNAKTAPFIFPEHESLTKVSKTPKNKYTKTIGSQYFEQEKGKGLDQIIQSRYNTTMHFPEYQIVGLLQSLVYSLAYLTKKQIAHHDFYPTNIFYNNGTFKLLNPLLIKCSGYSVTQQRKRFSFLSPQLILQVLNDKNQTQIRKDVMNKSDVFAIGMIVLQFCTLLPSSQCYDPETYSIIDSVIQQRIDKAQSIYNPLIGDCIDLMLQYQVDKRISPIQLSYAVHSKLLQIRTDKAVQQQKMNQISRLSMSAKIPQAPQGPPGQPNQRILIPLQGQPQNFFNSPPPNPPIVAGNMNNTQKINQLNNNIYMGSSLPVPSQNLSHQMFSSQGIQSGGGMPPSSISNMIPAPMYPPFSSPQQPPSNTFGPSQNYQISTLSQQTNTLNPPFVKNPNAENFNRPQYVTSDPISQPSTYISSTLGRPDQLNNRNQYLSQSSKQTKNILSPGSKMKLNPFEQIQQDFKQDDDQSPQKTTTSKNATMYFQQREQKKPVQPVKQTATDGIKLSNYTFKTAPYSSLNSGPSLSNMAKKQQTLDERVKRILQASKNIK